MLPACDQARCKPREQLRPQAPTGVKACSHGRQRVSPWWHRLPALPACDQARCKPREQLRPQAPTGVAACSHGCQPVEVSLTTHPSPDRGDSNWLASRSHKAESNLRMNHPTEADTTNMRSITVEALEAYATFCVLPKPRQGWQHVATGVSPWKSVSPHTQAPIGVTAIGWLRAPTKRNQTCG